MTSVSVPGIITLAVRPNVTENKAVVMTLATGAEINTRHVCLVLLRTLITLCE